MRRSKAAYGTEITINNADLKAMQNMSNADARVICTIPIDSREDLARVEQIAERELPYINSRMRATGYMISDFWYCHVETINNIGIYVRFDGYCIPYRYGKVQRMMTSELVQMCQRTTFVLQ